MVFHELSSYDLQSNTRSTQTVIFGERETPSQNSQKCEIRKQLEGDGETAKDADKKDDSDSESVSDNGQEDKQKNGVNPFEPDPIYEISEKDNII